MTKHEARMLALSGLLALAAAMGIGRFVYTPILPEMVASLGWSRSEAGFVASANFLGYLIGALLSGHRAIATSPRRWLLIGLAASALTTTAMAIAAPLIWLAALRLVGGIASAFVIVCASALILQRLQQSHARNLAFVHFGGVGFGIAVSALVVSGLAASGYGWQAMWLATGVLAMLAIPIAVLHTPDRVDVATPAAMDKVAPQRGLAGLTIAYGLFGFGYVITATFLVAIVRDTAAMRALEPWIWTIVGISALPSVLVWSWLSDRFGTFRAFALASLILAIGVLASVEWRTPVGAVVAALFLGATFMGLTALGISGAQQLSPGQSQRAIGQVTASFALGQMIGPALAGMLYDMLASFRIPSLLAAAALVIAAMIALRTGAAAASGGGRVGS